MFLNLISATSKLIITLMFTVKLTVTLSPKGPSPYEQEYDHLYTEQSCYRTRTCQQLFKDNTLQETKSDKVVDETR